MKPKPTIYLANPYGFSRQQRALLLPPIVERLSGLGFEVWEPFARLIDLDIDKPGWAREIASANAADVARADGVFAIINGTPPDEGVCFELGLACAFAKPTFLFRDDFRNCSDSKELPTNLMLFTGLPKEWQPYYYRTVEEISNPDGALARFAAGDGAFK